MSPYHHNPHECNCNSNEDISDNGVNGTGAASKGVSPGRCPMEEQRWPGHHQVTARMKWSKEVNRIVMRCFYKSEPNKRGYRKSTMDAWKEIGVFEVTEQRLADQSRAIRTNGWLSEVELEDIQRYLQTGDEANTLNEENTQTTANDSELNEVNERVNNGDDYNRRFKV